jgi:hypothetical protein
MMNMRVNLLSRFRIASVLAALLALTACSKGYQATIVYFNEQEGAREPYRTRMIVTPRYLRLDDDDDKGDFVLFDRNKRVIYSTNAMDQRTLVIRWKKTELSAPATMKNRDEKLDEKVPPIGKNEVRRYRLYTNDKVCYDLYAARDLLPNVVKAMAEFQQTLAVEHAAFMRATPLQTSSPCDQMSNVYQPARFLKYGFPIHARDYLGRMRQLADYKTDQTVSGDLFKLPADYEQFTTEQMRSGAFSR